MCLCGTARTLTLLILKATARVVSDCTTQYIQSWKGWHTHGQQLLTSLTEQHMYYTTCASKTAVQQTRSSWASMFRISTFLNRPLFQTFVTGSEESRCNHVVGESASLSLSWYCAGNSQLSQVLPFPKWDCFRALWNGNLLQSFNVFFASKKSLHFIFLLLVFRISFTLKMGSDIRDCFIVPNEPFRAQWLLYVPPGLTYKNSTFCPHSVFMCFVCIWEQTVIISLYSINW